MCLRTLWIKFLVFATNVAMCLKLRKIALDPFECDCKVTIEQVIHIDRWIGKFSILNNVIVRSSIKLKIPLRWVRTYTLGS